MIIFELPYLFAAKTFSFPATPMLNAGLFTIPRMMADHRYSCGAASRAILRIAG
jgi:hypothetical protein